MSEKIFIDGMSVNEQETRYGTIVKLGINVEKFMGFAKKNKNAKGYINIDILKNREGTLYSCLNDYKKS